MFNTQEPYVLQQWDLMYNDKIMLIGWNLCMKVCACGNNVYDIGNLVISAPCSDQYDQTQEWKIVSVP